MLRLVVRQKGPNLFWLRLNHDHEMPPAVVAVNRSVILLDALVGMQNIKNRFTPEWKHSVSDNDIDFSPWHLSGPIAFL
jgi:hypothetical protein